MTSAVADTPDTTSDLLVRAGIDATFQHIELLSRKQAQLRAAQIAAEEQFLHRVGHAHFDGRLSEVELALTYRAYSKTAIPGFMKRWDAAVSVPAQRVHHILRHLKTLERHAPNMPDGTWRGSWPLADDDRLPGYGTCVVYVLYDAANDPCYVGSTLNLKARLEAHEKDCKRFAWWTAFPCTDREAAYELEDRLLGEVKPYLNKRQGR